MILDLDRANVSPAEYDVCIAGAGIAGIVLAHQLATRGKRVLLLEAGGEEFSEVSQDSYKGNNIGHEYFDLDASRLRFLGGTSNHWGGWCRFLDPYDFERKPHIKESGWPIGFEEVDKYLPVALEILELEPFGPDRPFEGLNSPFNTFELRINAVRFRTKYREFLARSEMVDVLLNANVVDIVLKKESERVAAFTVEGYSGKRLQATGEDFVLAMGGIENARSLLNANKQITTGIGNENDIVGRYFMEHIVFSLGYYAVDSLKTDLGSEAITFVSPTPAFQQQAKVANCGLRFHKLRTKEEQSFIDSTINFTMVNICESDILTELARSIDWFFCPPPFDRAGYIRAASEQVPNHNSRVLLGEETDRFGLRRVSLDWRLSPIDKETMRKCLLGLAVHFAKRDIGRIKIDPWLMNEDFDFPPKDKDELAGYHHMGTTRMGTSAMEAVVDENCKVFGIPNLYVAGSSVFRTCGHANPTLSIVQLSVRLAEHLSKSNRSNQI